MSCLNYKIRSNSVLRIVIYDIIHFIHICFHQEEVANLTSTYVVIESFFSRGQDCILQTKNQLDPEDFLEVHLRNTLYYFDLILTATRHYIG